MQRRNRKGAVAEMEEARIAKDSSKETLIIKISRHKATTK